MKIAWFWADVIGAKTGWKTAWPKARRYILDRNFRGRSIWRTCAPLAGVRNGEAARLPTRARVAGGVAAPLLGDLGGLRG